MGLFDKVKGPIFLNENSGIKEDIEYLESIINKVPTDVKSEVEKELKNLSYGLKGEENIVYELKHCGIPMLIIQDLYLEHEGLNAQIDFLIITRCKYYIIESKNMYGDVVVCNTGDFIRKIGSKSTKIYSPITQCERHLQIIKNIRLSEKNNILTKMLFNQNFENQYLAVVVMANHNGKINTRFAPKAIKKKIIGADQLIRYIKEKTNSKDSVAEKTMESIANFFLSINKKNPKNYLNKYRDIILEDIVEITKDDGVVEDVESIVNEEVKKPMVTDNFEELEVEKLCLRCGSKMVLRLAKKGEHAGREFYGCSMYPKCRNIENISGELVK